MAKKARFGLRDLAWFDPLTARQVEAEMGVIVPDRALALDSERSRSKEIREAKRSRYRRRWVRYIQDNSGSMQYERGNRPRQQGGTGSIGGILRDLGF